VARYRWGALAHARPVGVAGLSLLLNGTTAARLVSSLGLSTVPAASATMFNATLTRLLASLEAGVGRLRATPRFGDVDWTKVRRRVAAAA
jgi:hypothetical protein